MMEDTVMFVTLGAIGYFGMMVLLELIWLVVDKVKKRKAKALWMAYRKEQLAKEQQTIKRKDHRNLIATLHRIRHTPIEKEEQTDHE